MADNSMQIAQHNRNGLIFNSSIVIATICIATLLATHAFAESFAYDKTGNRINNGETYNANNELLQSGSATYTHDANGNVTSKTENGQTTTFIYDVRDKLAQVQLPDGRTITYNYDPFGRRIKKDLAGDVTYYVYSDEGLIGEYDESGNPKKTYTWQPDGVWGTNPVAMEQNGNTYYYQNDHLGTPQRLIVESGTTVWQASYKAFGQAIIDPSSTLESNLRFPGQYFDEETELHYNWQRYYEPGAGRYTQVDPFRFKAGDFNLYRHVFNNPVHWIDPYGLWCIGKNATAAIAGALGGATSGGISGVMSGANPLSIAAGVLGGAAFGGAAGYFNSRYNGNEKSMAAGATAGLVSGGRAGAVAGAISNYGSGSNAEGGALGGTLGGIFAKSTQIGNSWTGSMGQNMLRGGFSGLIGGGVQDVSNLILTKMQDCHDKYCKN